MKRPAGFITRVLIAGVASISLFISAAGVSVASSSGPALWVGTVPLTAVTSAASGSWAVLAMGKASQPNNRFSEVFAQSSDVRTPGGTWQLVTPPGVADNGGLALGTDGTATTIVGFEPSQALAFSPVARSVDLGANWSPGSLGSSLVADPDAIAGSPGAGAFAVDRTSGGTLVQAGTTLLSWKFVTDANRLAALSGALGCGFRLLDAVTTVSGSPEVGGGCHMPGVVGIAIRVGRTWRFSGATLRGRAAHDRATVVRLENNTSGTTALVELDSRGRTGYVVLNRTSPGQPWTSSPNIFSTSPVVSTSLGPDGEVALVTASGTGRKSRPEIEMVKPGSHWSRIPTVPTDAREAILEPDGTMDILAVNDSRVVVSAITRGAAGAGAVVQTIRVPLQFGSST